MNRKDLTGFQFSAWTVIGFDKYYGSNPKWLCRCSCGVVKPVYENSLKYGKSKSCGDMAKHSPHIGKKFGRLTVLPEAKKFDGHIKYLCKCECGKSVYVEMSNLTSGNTKSCGCLTGIGGYSKERLYSIWRKMLERCERKECKSYYLYGGRGVSVCDEWHTYENFRNWSLSNGYSEELSIDRIDVNGNYEPSNCRWATKRIQANNTRANVFIFYKGEVKTIAEWANDCNIPYATLDARINKLGWDFEKAISTQVKNKNYKRIGIIKLGEGSHTVKEWAEIYGVSPKLIFGRLSKGWSEYDAITKSVAK